MITLAQAQQPPPIDSTSSISVPDVPIVPIARASATVPEPQLPYNPIPAELAELREKINAVLNREAAAQEGMEYH
jgi:hypothetical protein